MERLIPVLLFLAACGYEPAPDPGPVELLPDEVDYRCLDTSWEAGTCEMADVSTLPNRGATHIPEGEDITYEETPPASGPHRGAWAKWGEYAYLPPQRWVHNLEHGGIVFLYHPCADPALVDELRAFAKSRPADAAGEFRWILTPYPGLPTAVAAVAWQQRYEAECVDPAEMDLFTANAYRQAPEDVASDGTFDTRWLSR